MYDMSCKRFQLFVNVEALDTTQTSQGNGKVMYPLFQKFDYEDTLTLPYPIISE